MFKRYLFTCFFSITLTLAFAQLRQATSIKDSLTRFPIIDMHFHSDWWGIPEVKEPLTGLKSQADRKSDVAGSLNYLKKYNIVKR